MDTLPSLERTNMNNDTQAVPLPIKTYICILSYTSFMTRKFRSYGVKAATLSIITEKKFYKIGPVSMGVTRSELCY